jgi:hypothetical protein
MGTSLFAEISLRILMTTMWKTLNLDILSILWDTNLRERSPLNIENTVGQPHAAHAIRIATSQKALQESTVSHQLDGCDSRPAVSTHPMQASGLC